MNTTHKHTTMNYNVYTQLKTQEIDDIESCDDHNRSPLIDQVTKKQPVRRSCLKKWCYITLVVFLTLLMGLGIGSYMWFSHQLHTWTTMSPSVDILPMVVVPVDKLEIFKNEAKAFADYLEIGDSNTSPEHKPLEVTERNLNGLAYQSKFLQGHTYTHFVTNEVTIDICLPMDNFPGGKGRYLVGKETLVWDPEKSEIHTKLVLETSSSERVFYDATFHFETDNSGNLNLMLLSGYFAPLDWTAGKSFLDEHKNLLEYLQEDQLLWLRRIRRVSLKEEKVIIRAALDNMVPNDGGSYPDTLNNRAYDSESIA